MALKKIRSEYPHVSLFLDNETLFVWSKKTKELYLFEELSVAVFFYMEKFPTKVFEYFSQYANNQEFIELVKQIEKIIYKDIDKNILSQDIKFYSKKLNHNLKYKYYLSINKSNILIQSQTQEILNLIEKEFCHLQILSTNNIDFSISIIKNNKVFEIYINNQKYKEINNILNLVVSIQDIIRFYYYQKHNFLVALHSAVLKKDDKIFIFPAISGSGKSTLSAFLSCKDYEIFSDELCVIDENSKITPLPFGITLKEGSWDLVECVKQQLKNKNYYLRFDNQKVKIFMPKNFAKNNFKTNQIFFIFPKYIKDIKTSFKSISIKDALAKFINTGYHLINPNDENVVYKWLEILTNSKIYEVTFSNLDDMYNYLKRL